MSARFISLHYRGGTSNKEYHLQIVPNAEDPVYWNVLAQNGPRGKALTHRVKGAKLTSHNAVRLFTATVEKKKKSPGYYWEIPLEGPSLAAKNAADLAARAPPTLPAGATVLSVPPPAWAGFREDYAEACTFLGIAVNIKYVAAGIVILADLAQNLQEGIWEAAEICAKGRVAVLSSKSLSPECLAWVDSIPEVDQRTAFAYIKGQARMALRDA
jgi:hypothetical protein